MNNFHKNLKLILGLLILLNSFNTEVVFSEEFPNQTVMEIITDTPIMQATLKNYKGLVKKGKSVVFFYSSVVGEPGSTNMVKMWAEVSRDFGNKVKFLSIEFENDPRRKELSKLGIDGIPSYVFFVNGNVVYSVTGGPSNTKLKETTKISKDNMKELLEMK